MKIKEIRKFNGNKTYVISEKLPDYFISDISFAIKIEIYNHLAEIKSKQTKEFLYFVIVAPAMDGE